MSVAQSLACSFYNPINGDVVQVNRIHQYSGFTMTGSDEEDAAGFGVFNGEEAILDLHFYDSDPDILNQLRQWRDDHTPIRFVAAGSKSSILWDVDSTILFTEPKTFSPLTRQTYHVRLSAKGARLPIWQGKNLLNGFVIMQGFDSGWADTVGDGIPDGYWTAPNSGLNSSFNNGIFNFHSADVTVALQALIAFPIAGVPMTVSFDIPNVGNEANSYSRVFNEDFSESQLLFVQNLLDSTGRISYNFTTQEEIYALRVDLINIPSDNVGSRIAQPALVIGDSDQYIAG